MNDDIVALPNGDFKVVPAGSKKVLRFKHGDIVCFCDATWDYATAATNSGLGCEDICAIGQGPHVVELAKYDESGQAVVILKGYQHLAPFNQEMFLFCK